MYDRIVDEKMALASDSFGIHEAVKYATRTELEVLISDRESELAKLIKSTANLVSILVTMTS